MLKRWIHRLVGELWTRMGHWLHTHRHWNPRL